MPQHAAVAPTLALVLWAATGGGQEMERLPTAAEVDGTVRWFHRDAGQHLVAITDEAGRLVWSRTPLPYGGGPAPRGRLPRMLGRDLEPDVAPGGGYVFGPRLMLPVLGRFLTPDPQTIDQVDPASPQGYHPTAYALNNPYRYEDGSGYDPEELSERDRAFLAILASTSDEIIAEAAKDEELRWRVGQSPTGVDPLGSGGWRNFFQMIGGREGDDVERAKYVCTGISDRAVAVLRAAVDAGRLRGIESVRSISRAFPAEHVAVEVTYVDGTSLVFDWHANLNIHNPDVSTRQWWCNDSCRGAPPAHPSRRRAGGGR